MMLKGVRQTFWGKEAMSSHSIALAFCMVLMTVFGSVAFYWGKKSISLSKELAAEKIGHANTTQALVFVSAALEELKTVGREMYLELGDKAEKAAYLDHVVPCLEKTILHLVSQAASMNAKRLAEEKRELGARIVEFLIGVFFAGKSEVAPGI
jgi:hypothetical protein